jgi:hypothetical protein
MTTFLVEEVVVIKTLERPMVGTKKCANPICSRAFEPTRHNQKYCGKECCKLVTNAKIMEQYYEKKARKAGKKRVCETCPTVLSRYNEGSKCQSCLLEDRRNNREELLQLVGVA